MELKNKITEIKDTLEEINTSLEDAKQESGRVSDGKHPSFNQ